MLRSLPVQRSDADLASTVKPKSPLSWAKQLPVMEGLLPIDPSRVSIDVVAGMTLAALAIPEVMGYTAIAGMPVVTGLLHHSTPDHRVCDPRFVSSPGSWR